MKFLWFLINWNVVSFKNTAHQALWPGPLSFHGTNCTVLSIHFFYGNHILLIFPVLSNNLEVSSWLCNCWHMRIPMYVTKPCSPSRNLWSITGNTLAGSWRKSRAETQNQVPSRERSPSAAKLRLVLPYFLYYYTVCTFRYSKSM